MSWSIDIVANKPVKIDDLESCIENLPELLKGRSHCRENDWGWSCAVDITKPKEGGNSFYISGAVFSIDHARDMSNQLKKLLEEKGYKITLV